MKYAVDRIEGKLVVLENIDTKEIINININKLNFKVKEKDLLIYKDNTFIKDDNLKNERLKLLQEKLNRVKNIK